ncbi:MAG: hypothetical protein ACKOW9_05280, partial [Candidatus Paceibacterota bacterium]
MRYAILVTNILVVVLGFSQLTQGRDPLVWGSASGILALYLFFSFGKLEPNEIGAMLFFGRSVKDLKPGL